MYFLTHNTIAMVTRVFLLGCLLVATSARTQDAPIRDITIDTADAAAQIESEIESVEAMQSLDEELRSSVLEQLRTAKALLQSRLDAVAAADSYAAALDLSLIHI